MDEQKQDDIKHACTNVKIERNEKQCEVTVSASLPAERIERARKNAIKEYQKGLKMQGFRPGHVPEDKVIEAVGPERILARAAELAVSDEIPKLFAAENLFIVQAPKVIIDPPKEGQAVSFTAHAPMPPHVDLPDYEKIAAAFRTPPEETVSDDEFNDTMTHLKRERARIDAVEAGMSAAEATEKSHTMKVEELPDIDDAFAQVLNFENAAAFAENVRANIKNEKTLRANEKNRVMLLDAVIQKATIRYPEVLLQYELEDMQGQMQADAERAGTTLEAYLAQINKSLEEVRASWNDAAKKRVEVRLILSEIARKENILPNPEAVDQEIAHLQQHYPKADPATLRAHVEHAMRNELTVRFLEGNKEPIAPAVHTHDHAHE